MGLRAFGRLTGGRKIDLDLGCLFKLRDDQGSANCKHWERISATCASRPTANCWATTATAPAPEEFRLHINGQWNELDRVVFAMIYEARPTGGETDANMWSPFRPQTSRCWKSAS
ncbi:MAG: hypothetical protein IPI57_18955 [Candidatus Competibacteraceae bacterium]|nr:hypothetical protein [Candidatus Competibacteraceae bacterium]